MSACVHGVCCSTGRVSPLLFTRSFCMEFYALILFWQHIFRQCTGRLLETTMKQKVAFVPRLHVHADSLLKDSEVELSSHLFRLEHMTRYGYYSIIKMVRSRSACRTNAYTYIMYEYTLVLRSQLHLFNRSCTFSSTGAWHKYYK